MINVDAGPNSVVTATLPFKRNGEFDECSTSCTHLCMFNQPLKPKSSDRHLHIHGGHIFNCILMQITLVFLMQAKLVFMIVILFKSNYQQMRALMDTQIQISIQEKAASAGECQNPSPLKGGLILFAYVFASTDCACVNRCTEYRFAG